MKNGHQQQRPTLQTTQNDHKVAANPKKESSKHLHPHHAVGVSAHSFVFKILGKGLTKLLSNVYVVGQGFTFCKVDFHDGYVRLVAKDSLIIAQTG